MKTRWNGWAGMPGWARPRINETRREVDGGHWERDERKKDLRAVELLSTFRLGNSGSHPEIFKAWLIHENSCF